MLSRRTFLSLVGAGVARVTAVRVARAEPAVKVGSAVLGSYALSGPVVVAVEKGFFRAQGLAAEFVPFRGGPDLVKAVVAGEVLIGLTGSTDIIVFREAGLPIRMIAAQGDGNEFVLVSAAGGDIAKVGDLRGKSIGVTRAGAATWVFARMAAKAQGWDPERDVKIVALGGLDAQLAALARKEIAAFVWGDYGAVTEAQGRTKTIFRMDTLTPKWISAIQYASDDAIKKNADSVRKAQKALFQAMRFMKTSRDETAKILASALHWGVDEVSAVGRSSAQLLSEDGHINVEALRAMQDTLLEHGAIKKRVPIEDHYTTEFTPVKL